jgi:hypothetical protein
LRGRSRRSRPATSLEKLNEAIRISAEIGWLKMLGIKAESWDDLKRWVAGHWDEVIDAVKRRLEGVKVGSGFDLEETLKELQGLKSKLDDDNDKVAREVIAPALLLIQAERLGVNETTLKYFGAVISGAIDGDGYVSVARKKVGLTSGEREVALLWAAALAAYGIEAEVSNVGRGFDVVASGGNAARLAGLYFLYGSPLLEGDDRLKNHKRAEAVELGAEEALNVSWEGLRRRTEGGLVAADLTISEGDTKIKYNVYLWEELFLQFQSTDRSRVELAARLLRRAGIGAEVKKRKDRDVWYIRVTTDVLAAGRKELREAIAEIVKKAMENGGVDAAKAERWLKKLEEGRVLREGWPKYYVGLTHSGALEVKYQSTNLDSIKQEAQRLRDMGLEEGRHFTVKMPEEGRYGYVYIRREGLKHAVWLSVHGSGRQRELAAEFVEYILQRAKEGGEDVYRKALEVVEEGNGEGLSNAEGL